MPARRRWLLRWLLAATSTLITLACLELVLCRIVPKNGMTPFQSSTTEGLPYELRPGFKTLYKSAEVRINDLGFRGPSPDPNRPVHLALVGDSVTFGNCIGEDQTLACHLQSTLAARGIALQVLNCGVPGYNVENVVRFAEARVLDLNPALVVYVFVANDVSPSRGRTDPPPEAVIDPYAQFPLRSALLQFVGIRAKPLLQSIGLIRGGWTMSLLEEWRQGGDQRLRENLQELRQKTGERSIPLLVAAYPFMVAPRQNPFTPIEQSCAALCAELSIPFASLSHAFAPDENLIELWSNLFDSHPSSEANRRVSAVLADAVTPLLQPRSNH